ncbi:major facilitator superfamily domain-containing protein [Aspergillus caelatus]|uniref:Major facilitator superfamily domain-containing protein n=2 Tax=Aspergillus subgen. Circumdati TaxID=2720871 RepID=A0A5N7A3H1_9EURO|nr:major facilitator superfamily domain-containing protein [Aspergillus caelatus]KAE8363726.1 major facilitator superfamily domain-containing protein [Aspergillus caelatus]KAE8419297.1 major facilitator superfamily domain-containing protein [Aspergillus pseudocaelatus]
MEARVMDMKTPPVDSEESILEQQLDQEGLRLAADGCVHWRTDNPRHPRNWPLARKVHDVAWIIFLDFFVTCASTAGAPAARAARNDTGMNEILSIFIFVPLYMVGQGIGSVIFPPYSEAFGRKKLYVVSTGLYSICCVLVAVVPFPVGVVIGRFISGFLSAIPAVIAAGSIEDLFNARDRIWMMSIWTVVWNIGSIIGPIFGTGIVSVLDWRWVFYIAAIVTGVLTLILMCIKESRPSLLLKDELRRFEQTILNGKESHLQSWNPDHVPDLHTLATVTLIRPLRLFVTEPIVFLVSVVSPIPYTLIYLFTEALPPVYQSFGFSVISASLPFLAIGIGLLLSFGTRIYDYQVLTRRRQNGLPITPEDKLMGFVIGAPVFAIGMWLFAWTIPPKVLNVHWIVSMIGLVCVGYSNCEFTTVLTGYLADNYLSYAASGFAAQSFLRALLTAASPLFAPAMFNGLGNNVAVSVLAAVATVFCAVPPLFKRYGAELRARSKFAQHSLDSYQLTTVDEDGY